MTSPDEQARKAEVEAEDERIRKEKLRDLDSEQGKD